MTSHVKKNPEKLNSQKCDSLNITEKLPHPLVFQNPMELNVASY